MLVIHGIRRMEATEGKRRGEVDATNVFYLK